MIINGCTSKGVVKGSNLRAALTTYSYNPDLQNKKMYSKQIRFKKKRYTLSINCNVINTLPIPTFNYTFFIFI